jgi:hypothetical protein
MVVVILVPKIPPERENSSSCGGVGRTGILARWVERLTTLAYPATDPDNLLV